MVLYLTAIVIFSRPSFFGNLNFSPAKKEILNVVQACARLMLSVEIIYVRAKFESEKGAGPRKKWFFNYTLGKNGS